MVPEARWIKHPTHMESFNQETIDHYRDHVDDLAAILAAAAGSVTLAELLLDAAADVPGVSTAVVGCDGDRVPGRRHARRHR